MSGDGADLEGGSAGQGPRDARMPALEGLSLPPSLSPPEEPEGGPPVDPSPEPVAPTAASGQSLSRRAAVLLDPDRRSGLESVRDNVEAIAFALILALLLRQFTIEVFKIPTPSMQPTLFGDNSSVHPGTDGDRILVDKAAYLFQEPSRWDVMVFHYPLDWSRNFIKRVAGLPNEAFRIERGDVWVSPWVEGKEPVFHPARKPRRVREQLYVPLYPPVGSHAGDRVEDYWREEEGATDRFDRASHHLLKYRGDREASGATTPAVLAYGFPIRDVDRNDEDPRSAGSDYFLVPDIRVRMTVVAEGPAEVEIGWAPGGGRRQVLRLASAGHAPSELRSTGASFPLAPALVPGRPMRLELESVDGDVRGWVDGEELKVLEDEIPIDEADRLENVGEGEVRQKLTLSVKGSPLELRDVRVDHDLYYTNSRGGASQIPRAGDMLHIGPEQYFMLGDNTRKSSDSRAWRASGIRFKDGSSVFYDSGVSPTTVTVDGRPMREVVDVEGVLRRWSESDVESSEGDRRMPTVHRDRVIGRAWYALIFWPFSQALERLRFIH